MTMGKDFNVPCPLLHLVMLCIGFMQLCLIFNGYQTA